MPGDDPATSSSRCLAAREFVLSRCWTLARRRRNLRWVENLFVAGAVEDVRGVGEKLGNSVERFHGTFGAAGKIHAVRGAAGCKSAAAPRVNS